MASEKKPKRDQRGQKNYNAKLTQEDVNMIRRIAKGIFEEAAKSGQFPRGWKTVLAYQFNVHRMTITRILLSQTWAK